MRRSPLFITTVFSLIVSLPAQGEPTLQQLRQEYLNERKTIAEDQTLLFQYQEKLLSLKQNATEQGDLDKVLALKAALEEKEPVAGKTSRNPEVYQLQKIYLKQKEVHKRQIEERIQILMRAYGRKLTALRSELTKQQLLEKALEVDKEIKSTASELTRISRSHSITPMTRLKGRFHVSVDDWVSIFLNGKLVHRGGLNESASAIMDLGVGDRVVAEIKNKKARKRFQMVFRSTDGSYLINFRAHDYRLMDSTIANRNLTAQTFASLKQTAVNQHLGPTRFPFKNESDWVWGHGGHAVLGAIVGQHMIAPGSGPK